LHNTKLFFKGISDRGAGYSGAYLYNNRDLLDEVLQNGVRGAIHHYSSPSRGLLESSASLAALDDLSREVAELRSSQHHGYSSIVVASQPTTVLGLPVWQAVGIAGTLGYIYFKVQGYEMRDLVYVSKKHFTTVTETLQEQFGVVQQALGTVKTELIERVCLVETKLVETREALEALIGFRFSKVEKNVDNLSSELSNATSQLSENTAILGQITGDLVDMKSNVSAVAVELDGRITEVSSKVGELREQSNENFEKMTTETNNIDMKIERLSDQTVSQLLSLQSGIEESQKGISLLCEYVSAQTGVNSTIAQNMESFVQSDSRALRFGSFPMFHRRSISSSGSLPFIIPISGV